MTVLAALLGIDSLAAQSCGSAAKSNSSASTQSSASVQYEKPSEQALKAAAMDPSIETKTCEKTGKVCFKKKSVDAATGEVSYHEVRYDEATASFVNFTPAAESGKAKACCKGKKACSKSSSAAANTAPASHSAVGPESNKE